MFASLLLDLKKVNVESSIFIVGFENCQLLLAAYMLVVFSFSPALKQKC